MILEQQVGTYIGGRADYFGFGYSPSMLCGIPVIIPASYASMRVAIETATITVSVTVPSLTGRTQ